LRHPLFISDMFDHAIAEDDLELSIAELINMTPVTLDVPSIVMRWPGEVSGLWKIQEGNVVHGRHGVPNAGEASEIKDSPPLAKPHLLLADHHSAFPPPLLERPQKRFEQSNS
jgi:hypothetical protein